MASLRSSGVTSLFVAIVLLAGCGGSGPARAGSPAATASSPAASVSSSAAASAQPAAVPQPGHTVVVVMENHSYADIIGNSAAPFINALAHRGALFTRSFAITYPSEPNYLALFSGSTQGVADDGCTYRFSAPNLAADLIKAGKSFAGYVEDLPGAGAAWSGPAATPSRSPTTASWPPSRPPAPCPATATRPP